MVIADLIEIELRVAGELSGDEAMRQVFRDGGDIHMINAEDFIGSSLEALPEDEREIVAQQGQADRFRHALRQRRARPRGLGLVHVPDRHGEAEAQPWKDRSTPVIRSCAPGRTGPPTRRASPACCVRSSAGRSGPSGSRSSR